MVDDFETAKRLAESLQASFNSLDESAAIVRQHCSKEETDQYLRAVGPVCAEIVFKLMEPLYLRHPELKPAGWGD
jgi:hypothetical protein